MKKKHRDIIVNGIPFGWRVHNDTLKIWEHKKIIHREDVSHCVVLPSDVADIIKNITAYKKDYKTDHQVDKEVELEDIVANYIGRWRHSNSMTDRRIARHVIELIKPPAKS